MLRIRINKIIWTRLPAILLPRIWILPKSAVLVTLWFYLSLLTSFCTSFCFQNTFTGPLIYRLKLFCEIILGGYTFAKFTIRLSACITTIYADNVFQMLTFLLFVMTANPIVFITPDCFFIVSERPSKFIEGVPRSYRLRCHRVRVVNGYADKKK